ncbi:toll/interleukin-1 receptor domain-containing protein [Alloacidobacterium sp.]|uniref:toll/interleukin-1 receptor domain-containing protein n=1 Tax=Alloacidobacterium sp. TaxID=2951999 RepID=UPI002D30ED81|nr:toll/interleukin-1 receptor domain-containing protein [Alloacidobacterium sp.]HYK36820.1 toll/interleukin-1 receptor domain-containing protein [Alloacidobacterium sp.]
MMKIVRRSIDARVHREPDVFLSHSSRDKEFVRRLSEDLTFCEIDPWLDEWEIQAGDSLFDRIGDALEKSRYTAIVLGDHFSDSDWARIELKQALAKERRKGAVHALPIICGNSSIPAFLEDKVFIDFRTDYHAALSRLAAHLHGIERIRIEDAIRFCRPKDLGGTIECLRDVGIEPYIVLGEADFNEIIATGHVLKMGDKVRFDPEAVCASDVSPRIRRLMRKLIDEVWR